LKAAYDIVYGVYGDDEQSSTINDLLSRLDFHAHSMKLLATTAFHNVWDYDRLAKEWDAQRATVLETDYNKSLAVTIELSLASRHSTASAPMLATSMELSPSSPKA
jgi:hypothetical protein